LLSIVLFLAACELTVVVDLPEQEPKLVINSLYSKDSTWVVNLTLSKGMYDTSWTYQPVSNAQVRLFKDGNWLQDLSYDAVAQAYTSNNNLPEPGAAYRLEVTAPGFSGTISADDTLPQTVPIHSLEFQRDAWQKNGKFMSDLKIRFQDPAGWQYYALELYALDTLGGNVWLSPCFTSDDPVFNQGSIGGPVAGNDNEYCERVYFSDQLIGGKDYTLKISINSENLEYSQFIVVVLYSLSRNYYYYNISRDLQFDTKYNPFAEPVMVFSNIQNGLGIFGGYSLSYSIQPL